MARGKWITIAPADVPKGWRTLRWKVLSLDGDVLGYVQWFPRWRCYSFFPLAEAILEKTCLRDIADFCDVATSDHIRARPRGAGAPKAIA